MAVIAKLSTGVRPADIPDGHTLAAAEEISAGDMVRFDNATNRFTKANATSAGEAVPYGIALSDAVEGLGVTAVRRGKIAGFDLSAMANGAAVFLSRTDGGIDDSLDATAGTVSVTVGKVVPVGGEVGGKVLEVNL